MIKYSVTSTGALSNITNKSILQEWVVLQQAPVGCDVTAQLPSMMTNREFFSVPPPVDYYTGSLSFLWHKINTKNCACILPQTCSHSHQYATELFFASAPSEAHHSEEGYFIFFSCYSPQMYICDATLNKSKHNAFLQLPYWTEMVMEKRAGDKGKINNLFYLMGCSVTVMR